MYFSTGLEKDATGGDEPSNSVHGTNNTYKVTSGRTQKQTSNTACMYLFSVDDHRVLRYLRQRCSASLTQCVNIKAAPFLPLIIGTCAQLSLSNCLTQEATLPVMEFGKVMCCPLGMTGDWRALCAR